MPALFVDLGLRHVDESSRSMTAPLRSSHLRLQDSMIGCPMREQLWGDPRESEAAAMEFRLTYAGPLRADTRSARDIASHKQEIRRCFHRQLAYLWEQRPYLRKSEFEFPDQIITTEYTDKDRLEELAKQYARIGFRFVPLVTEDLAVSCAVDILYLRNGPPGGIVQRQDIDNRIKTLFDAFKMPEALQDLGDHTKPGTGEDPFFCLVSDDSLITSLSVTTDLLLEPIGATHDRNNARLLITVTLRPARLTWQNMAFG
jgi:hypothetical protein